MAKFVLATALIGAAAATSASAQYGPSTYGQGWGPNEPVVRINQYDGGTVNMRNGCIVTFNSYGTVVSRTRRCSPRLEGQAREVFRRCQVGRSGRSGWGGGWTRPQVSWWGNAVRVDFPGAGCTYLYSRNGEHMQTIGSRCTSQMRAIANEAQTVFRRGWRG